MIRIVELTKEFGGNYVLRGVNLEVAQGEALFVLGPSGAGKSTLLRCLNGLYWPSSGIVWIGGMKLERRNLAAIRRRVGFIFQAYQLLSNLSVLRNVLIGRLAEKPGWSLFFSKRDVHLACEAIEAVGLGDKVHARVSELSGGQKQRVGIARALAHDPMIPRSYWPMSRSRAWIRSPDARSYHFYDRSGARGAPRSSATYTMSPWPPRPPIG
jgi:phosphonate transport system ATP-binding protein